MFKSMLVQRMEIEIFSDINLVIILTHGYCT